MWSISSFFKFRVYLEFIITSSIKPVSLAMNAREGVLIREQIATIRRGNSDLIERSRRPVGYVRLSEQYDTRVEEIEETETFE